MNIDACVVRIDREGARFGTLLQVAITPGGFPNAQDMQRPRAIQNVLYGLLAEGQPVHRIG